MWMDIVVTALRSAALTLWSPFRSRCASTPVCSQTRLFRNEPRLRSVVNPSHRWLAPREPRLLGTFAVTRISLLVSLFIHKKTEKEKKERKKAAAPDNRPETRATAEAHRTARAAEQQQSV